MRDLFRPRSSVRERIVRLALLAAALALPLAGGWWMIWMPGRSFRGALPPQSPAQAELAQSLQRDVIELAGTIGERNVFRHASLERAADWIDAQLRSAGYDPQRQTFEVDRRPCHNIEVELAGGKRASEVIVVGAHYDSALGAPGANDNASGVAALLALARALRGTRPERTLRLVWFTNEEPPHFQSADMGSVRYARRARQRGDDVVGMLSLETMGCYSDAADSQRYPLPLSAFYPNTGNFIAFVGNIRSRALTRRALAAFRAHARFPSEGAALPASLPGVGWSDHDSFWREGYAAVMVTDTAPFRYAHYHTGRDTPDKLDYDRLARVTEGLLQVVIALGSDSKAR